MEPEGLLDRQSNHAEFHHVLMGLRARGYELRAGLRCVGGKRLQCISRQHRLKPGNSAVVVDQAEFRARRVAPLVDLFQYTGQDSGSIGVQEEFCGCGFREKRLPGMRFLFVQHRFAGPLVTAKSRRVKKGAKLSRPFFLRAMM